jgi:hypothetical protein
MFPVEIQKFTWQDFRWVYAILDITARIFSVCIDPNDVDSELSFAKIIGVRIIRRRYVLDWCGQADLSICHNQQKKLQHHTKNSWKVEKLNKFYQKSKCLKRILHIYNCSNKYPHYFQLNISHVRRNLWVKKVFRKKKFFFLCSDNFFWFSFSNQFLFSFFANYFESQMQFDNQKRHSASKWTLQKWFDMKWRVNKCNKYKNYVSSQKCFSIERILRTRVWRRRAIHYSFASKCIRL